jgi:hypothetical protein
MPAGTRVSSQLRRLRLLRRPPTPCSGTPLADDAGGTHEIAGGVSNRAPCTAFLNLHENVHVGVFLGGQFPNTVTVQFIEGTC